MDNPAQDLIVLKKICKELQKELAFSTPDVENPLPRLAEPDGEAGGAGGAGPMTGPEALRA